MKNDVSWYEDKTLKELEGCHVSVLYDNGAKAEGRLDEYGCIDTGKGVGKGFNLVFNQKLFESHCFTTEGVKSVTLLWDERAWRQIDVKDTLAGDSVIVNNRRVQVSWVSPGDGFALWDGGFVKCANVSYALRSKAVLPSKSGFYRTKADSVLYLSEDHEWLLIGNDYIELLVCPPTDLLPLTPVRFENRRFEDE